jgi:hypothetical protein
MNSRAVLPLPEYRERAGVRVRAVDAKSPHPNPLPEYRERGLKKGGETRLSESPRGGERIPVFKSQI